MVEQIVFTRATFFKLGGAAAAGALLVGCHGDGSPPKVAPEDSAHASGAEQAAAPPPTGDEALKLLTEGNARFANNEPTDVNEGSARRAELTKGQTPFALILGCIDSRVPPEIVFDRGLGDLMVVRTGGEVVDRAVIGSLEFGVAEIKIPLLMVLGHEGCGAIKSTIAAISDNNPDNGDGDIEFLVNELAVVARPIKAAHPAATPDELISLTVDENARAVARKLTSSSAIIGDAVKAGKLKVVSARYDLDSGKVELLT